MQPLDASARYRRDESASTAKMGMLKQSAAVATPANGTVTVVGLDTGIVPSLVNLIGGGGVEAETRLKVNELIAAYTDLSAKYVLLYNAFADDLAKRRTAGQLAT